DAVLVHVAAVEVHVALEPEAPDEVVHAVEAPQHGALAAARGADEAGDLAALDGHAAVPHRQELAVVDLVELAVDDHVASHGAVRRLRPFQHHAQRGLSFPAQPRRWPTRRLTTLMTRTMRTRTSEAAQASSSWLSNGMPEKL